MRKKKVREHFQAVASAPCIFIKFRCTRVYLRVRRVFLTLFFFCVSERFTSIRFHEAVLLFCVVNAFPLVNNKSRPLPSSALKASLVLLLAVTNKLVVWLVCVSCKYRSQEHLVFLRTQLSVWFFFVRSRQLLRPQPVFLPHRLPQRRSLSRFPARVWAEPADPLPSQPRLHANRLRSGE